MSSTRKVIPQKRAGPGAGFGVLGNLEDHLPEAEERLPNRRARLVRLADPPQVDAGRLESADGAPQLRRSHDEMIDFVTPLGCGGSWCGAFVSLCGTKAPLRRWRPTSVGRPSRSAVAAPRSVQPTIPPPYPALFPSPAAARPPSPASNRSRTVPTAATPPSTANPTLLPGRRRAGEGDLLDRRRAQLDLPAFSPVVASRPLCSSSRSTSSRFRTLPVALRGSSSMNSTSRGVL